MSTFIQRELLLCRRIYFSFHVECRRICFIHRPVSLIFTVVSVYIRTSVDVHPKITLAVSTYLLHTSTCIQQLWNVCRRTEMIRRPLERFQIWKKKWFKHFYFIFWFIFDYLRFFKDIKNSPSNYAWFWILVNLISIDYYWY